MEQSNKESLQRVAPRLRDSVKEVLETDLSSEYEFPQDGLRCGPEEEFFVFEGTEPVSQSRRDEIIEDTEVDSELGSAMIETSPEPQMTSEAEELENFLREQEQLVLSLLSDGEYIVRNGVMPSELGDIELTDGPRYDALIDKYEKKNILVPEEMGRIGYETINPENVRIPGAIAAHQLNIQPPNEDEGVEWGNILYAVQPYVLALSGTSRVIDGVDTGLAEPGKYMWPLNFNLREDGQVNDVGKWQDFRDDILDDLSSLEPVTEFELEEDEDELVWSKKQDWKYVKQKYDVEDGQMIIEWRALPQQPSIEENVAMNEMMLGLLGYSLLGEGPDIEDIDISDVNFNYDSAMLYGKDHELYDLEGNREAAEDVLEKAIDQARTGSKLLNRNAGKYLDLMEMRLDYPDDLEPGDSTYRGTPSERTAERFRNATEMTEAVPKRGES